MKRIVLLSILFLFSANISAQNKKAERIAKKEAAYQEVKQLVENGNFTFNALWLITQGGWRVDTDQITSTLEFNNETITADLPFFGIVQFGLGYGGDGGINFKGTPTNYKIDYQDAKRRIKLSFTIKNKNEVFDVFATIYGSGSTTIQINSVNRNSIDYRGFITALKEDVK
jgi:hypothetical protein